jgi:hypothetical protein
MSHAPKKTDAKDDGKLTFRQQLICIVLGAVIGAVPALVIAIYQTRETRLQALFFRKLDALKEFSNCVSDGGNLMNAANELEVSIHRLIRRGDKATSDDVKHIDDMYKEIISERFKWTAKVQAQSVEIAALFGPDKQEQANSHNEQFSDLKGREEVPHFDSKEEELEWMQKDAGRFKKQLSGIIDGTQSIILRKANELLPQTQ